MTVRVTRALTRKERRNYVVIDPIFNTEARVRTLALAAAAMIQWTDHAKATFSVSTAERYLESLYWEAHNPDRIVMGVFPNTLASLLEHGQDPKDLNSIFLRKAKLSKKGHAYKHIPIDDERNIQYLTSGMALSVSAADISYYVNHMSPKIAAHAIVAKMSKFDKSNISSKSFKPSGKFLVNSKTTKFKTITSAGSPNKDNINKPHETWKHPGIRAALLGNQVSSWMELNRESYMSPLFGKEPGFII